MTSAATSFLVAGRATKKKVDPNSNWLSLSLLCSSDAVGLILSHTLKLIGLFQTKLAFFLLLAFSLSSTTIIFALLSI